MGAAMNRRGILSALAVAPALALPAAVQAFPSVGGNWPAWNAALSAFEHARAAHLAAIKAHDDASERYFALRPEESIQVWFAEGDTVASYNARRAVARAADQQARIDSGEAETGARQAATCNADYAALTALLATPAPDLAAVLHKLAVAREEGLEVDELDGVAADLERFAGLPAGRA